MSDLKPVSRPSFLLDGRGGLVLVVVGLALVVAFLKPWGSNGHVGGRAHPRGRCDALADRRRRHGPRIHWTRRPGRTTHSIFGDHELRATWGLWPAGYMVSFGFAMNMEPSSPPSPTGGSSSSSPGAPDDSRLAGGHRHPAGNHLLLIGVDTPIGFSVDDIRLVRQYRAAGGTVPVRVVLPPSPWPSHFTVIAVDGGYGVERTAFWTAGRYRLDLALGPGTIERSIEIRVEGTPRLHPSASALPVSRAVTSWN